MLTQYKRRSNFGAVVFLAGTILAVWASRSTPGNIWDNGNTLAQLGLITAVCGWFYALWAYVKAKGRSGAWVLLGFLSLGMGGHSGVVLNCRTCITRR